MFNPDAVGKQHKSEKTFTVSADHVSAFARAIGEADTHNSPVTYSISFSLDSAQAFLQEQGLDWSRVVHGDQKFKINRPFVAGDVVATWATIESFRAVAGNEIVTVRSDLYCGDELVQQQWTTLVARA
jgi:hypothetical protein